MKKLISLMMCVIMIVSLSPSQMVLAATAAKSGVCGDDLTWKLDSAGTLTINGTGEMTDYYMIGDWEGNAPWDIDSVKTVIISEGVTSIGDLAFFQCGNLTNITISDSVTSIGSIAFALCNGLTEITISKGVTDICPDAFLYCSNLASIFVDEQNEAYMSKDGVLFDKSGTTLKHCPNGKTGTYTVPNGVTSIGDGAFNGCNKLTEITITDKVTDIGNSAFSSCYILTDVYYDGTQTDWNNINIGTHNDDLLSANIHYADEDVDNVVGYDKCGDNLTWTLDTEGTLTISGTGDMYDYSYGDMPWSEFRDEIYKIEFTDGVTSIGETAFYYCSAITNVNIPSGITDIGYDAFRDCEKLEAINVDENNQRYSSVDGVLFDKEKTILMAYPPAKPDPSYEIPNSVIIVNLAFEMCNNLTTITIPESVVEIYDGFSCDNLKNIVVDEKNTQFSSVDGVLFDKNKTMLYRYPSGRTNASYIVPNEVDTICGFAFHNCISLKNIELSNSVVDIMEGAFYHCEGLENIEIPSSITEIAEWTFGDCYSLGNINIPSNVRSIGDFAFYNCSNITAFYFDGNAPTIGTETFPNDVILCVPQDASGWTVPTWNGYTTTHSMVTPISYIELNLTDKSMSVGETVTLIATIFPNDATNKDIAWTSGNTSVATVDNGIVTAKSIGNATIFATTSNGKSASCEISVTSLVGSCGDNLRWSLDYKGNLIISGNGDMTNYNRDNLAPWYSTNRDIKTIILPNGLTSIGDYAFWQCRKVTNIEIPNTVKSIGNSAFEYCENITSVYIPDSVTNIGNNAFWYCKNLSSARIPNNLTNINSGVFSFCDNLTDVTIPNGVTSIGEEAFRGCKSLTNIVIPDSVTDVAAWAFSGCENLVNIKFSKNMDTIEHSTFSACNSLTEITIPDNIVGIGDEAFSACNSLTSVKIHSNVRGIDSEAFRSCKNLISIDVDVDNPYYIVVNGMLFYREMSGLVLCPAGFSEVIIPNGVEYIESRAFFDCKKLNSITIPNSIKEIEYSTFYGCDNITKVLYQGSYEEWKNIRISSSDDEAIICANIQYDYDGSNYATYGTCGKNLNWSLNADGVLKIDGTGDMCDYENIYSDNGLYAKVAPWFFDYDTIKSVEISNGVTSIGERVLSGCDNLENVYYMGTQEQWNNIDIKSFNDGLARANIHFVGEKTASGILRSGDGWFINWDCTYNEDDEGNISNGEVTIQMTGSGDEGDLYVFNGSGGNFPWEEAPYNIPKTAIEKLTIKGHSNVSLRVATNSFKGYNNLKTFIGAYLSGVDSNAFEGCSSLEKVAIAYPKDNFSYGANSFKDCINLSDVTFSEKLYHIGTGAFQNTKLGTIILYDNINEIGENAFSGCSNIKIRCYKDSLAHQYAMDNNISFELISGTNCSIYHGDAQPEYFNCNLEEYILQSNSTTYNPTLSHMLAAMSRAAYDENNVIASIESLGLGEIHTQYQSNLINYSFSKKNMRNGKKLVLVTVKGTPLLPLSQWGSNLTLGSKGWHDGFAEACYAVYSDLLNYLDSNFEDTVFVLTGHSRGAAVSNLLAVNLSLSGIAQKNIYAYTFACPDVAVANDNDWNPSGKYNNIFNMCHVGDIVTEAPGGLGNTFFSDGFSLWGKYGQSHWFANNWDDSGETTYGPKNYFASHDADIYLSYMRHEHYLNSYRTREEARGIWTVPKGVTIDAACPVDVIVNDSTDQPIASVIGGIPNYYDSEYGDVIIMTDGERKWIYVCGNQSLNVELTATGAGTMTYSVASIGSELGANVSEKTFENVLLTTGKKMKNEVKATEEDSVPNMADTPLYVVDDEGDIIKEVLPDGAGTEIELKTVTFDANGGSVSAVTAKTNAGGKLIDLPTPTRSNYTFDGWYDNANGGTKITTDTIFTQDTTIYAHWSKSSSVGSSGGGGGGAISEHTVKFETNGGNTIDPVKVSKNSVVIEPTAPTKENYNFEGWYTNKELTIKYDFTEKVTESFALYAKWVENVIEWQNPFADIDMKDWYYEAVKFANEKGLMKGVSKMEFAPNLEVTRGMFVTILYRLEQEPIAPTLTFADVDGDEYYADAIAWASANGIVSGVSDAEFAPNNNITREQMATILFRYATYKGMDATTLEENLEQFTDNTKISEYAVSALNWAVGTEIISGKGNGILDPLGNATRVEVATILQRFIEK